MVNVMGFVFSLLGFGGLAVLGFAGAEGFGRFAAALALEAKEFGSAG
jgi:hypothetical protein